MGKLSISLGLLFSMLVLHANGNLMQPENIDDTLQTESNSPEEVKKWYDNLHKKRRITSTFNVFFHANGTGDNPNQVLVGQNYLPRLVPRSFGMVQTLDYPLTATDDINSEVLGIRPRLLLCILERGIQCIHNHESAVSKILKQHSFLIGQDNFNDKYREFTIVGGTDIFRQATGTVISVAHSYVPSLAIVELTVIVRHYVEYIGTA